MYPVAIVAGNFTNNGILDLATADANGTGTDDYSVYLGNGDGTFQGPTPYALGGDGVFDRHGRRAISPATAGPTWRSPGPVPTTCRCS